MIVTGLNKLKIAAVRLSDLVEWYGLLQEIRQRQAVWLAFRVRHLNAKGNSQVSSLRCIERQSEYGIEVQFAWFCLHVSPVTPDVENIDKRQARQIAIDV